MSAYTQDVSSSPFILSQTKGFQVFSEPEFCYPKRKQNEGIEVDETTWKAICDEAKMFGLNPDQWLY